MTVTIQRRKVRGLNVWRVASYREGWAIPDQWQWCMTYPEALVLQARLQEVTK